MVLGLGCCKDGTLERAHIGGGDTVGMGHKGIPGVGTP